MQGKHKNIRRNNTNTWHTRSISFFVVIHCPQMTPFDRQCISSASLVVGITWTKTVAGAVELHVLGGNVVRIQGPHLVDPR